MADYERSHSMSIPPEALFAYLSDVRNLPHYFPRMRSAERIGGGEAIRTTAVIDGDDGTRTVEGEAWFRVDEAKKSIAWGSEGDNDYHGELDVASEDEGVSSVTVRIHTQHRGDDVAAHINDGLEQTLRAIERVAAPQSK